MVFAASSLHADKYHIRQIWQHIPTALQPASRLLIRRRFLLVYTFAIAPFSLTGSLERLDGAMSASETTILHFALARRKNVAFSLHRAPARVRSRRKPSARIALEGVGRNCPHHRTSFHSSCMEEIEKKNGYVGITRRHFFFGPLNHVERALVAATAPSKKKVRLA